MTHITSNHPPSNQGLIGSQPRLLLLPSVTVIVSNMTICKVILQAVSTTGAHLPPNKFTAILPLLCEPGSDPFDNRFLQWAPTCASRNIKDCAMEITDGHSQWDNATTPHPSAL